MCETEPERGFGKTVIRLESPWLVIKLELTSKRKGNGAPGQEVCEAVTCVKAVMKVCKKDTIIPSSSSSSSTPDAH